MNPNKSAFNGRKLPRADRQMASVLARTMTAAATISPLPSGKFLAECETNPSELWVIGDTKKEARRLLRKLLVRHFRKGVIL